MLFRNDGFCTTHSFNTLFSERKYENNLKNGESQIILILLIIMIIIIVIYIMFT